MKEILVRGSGDVGSAVAHLLFTEGYAVLIHDSAQPTATRRKMSFCDAVFDGSAILAGVQARLATNVSDISLHLASHDLARIPHQISERGGADGHGCKARECKKGSDRGSTLFSV
jgi:hypothetical protein